MDEKQKCRNCGTTDNLTIHYVKQTYTYYVCRPCKQNAMRKFYDKRKSMVFEHYGGCCACCYESQELFLTIDHINNDGNQEKWASGSRIGGRQLYQKIVKNDYPDKYQLLCMNCNFGKRMNDGVCPHKMV